ncbi:hypothetical protein [Laspinema olomoucense]|uniref:Uncharacterized protein n=1 Tax=Laspinema olomoucense D3b TaxID=2953688 RepID=A0ABT2NF09_9CYAN|nr:hypothetical protein [Laspinema sp. D3b]MCT7979836.1 hypothetical protein [Laspinema sp. D3b]
MKMENSMPNSSRDDSEALTVGHRLQINLRKNNKPDNKTGGFLWYTVLSMYAFLLIVTGSVTFLYNNGWASREENLKKIEAVRTPEQLAILTELLDLEVKNMNAVNNLASQSFNVVLGALLGFLSATVTALNKNAEEREKTNIEEEENRLTVTDLNERVDEEDRLAVTDLNERVDEADEEDRLAVTDLNERVDEADEEDRLTVTDLNERVDEADEPETKAEKPQSATRRRKSYKRKSTIVEKE